MVNGLEFEIGSAQCLSFSADQVKVLVPTYAKVQGQVAPELPIILEVNAEHLGAPRQIKVRVTRGCGHATNSPGRREAVRVVDLVRQNLTGEIVEVEFQRWIEFKESTKLPFPDIVGSGSESVLASGNREIVLELILRLVGLLGHVCVRPEANAARKGKQRDFALGINNVVPVLITDRSGINYRAAQH